MHKNGRNGLRSMHQSGDSAVSHCHGVSTVFRQMHREGITVFSCKVLGLVRPPYGNHFGDDCTFRIPVIGETSPEKSELSMDSNIVKRQRKK